MIEKPNRSADDDEAMTLCSAASLWHWTQRSDCTSTNLSIGHWQLARVFALCKRGQEAMHHAQRSLHFAEGNTPFFIGYAHEAIARAAWVLGDLATTRDQISKAKAYAAVITEDDEREQLLADLRELDALISA